MYKGDQDRLDYHLCQLMGTIRDIIDRGESANVVGKYVRDRYDDEMVSLLAGEEFLTGD